MSRPAKQAPRQLRPIPQVAHVKLIDVILAIIATIVFAAAVVYLMFLFSLAMIIAADE